MPVPRPCPQPGLGRIPPGFKVTSLAWMCLNRGEIQGACVCKIAHMYFLCIVTSWANLIISLVECHLLLVLSGWIWEVNFVSIRLIGTGAFNTCIKTSIIWICPKFTFHIQLKWRSSAEIYAVFSLIGCSYDVNLISSNRQLDTIQESLGSKQYPRIFWGELGDSRHVGYTCKVHRDQHQFIR